MTAVTSLRGSFNHDDSAVSVPKTLSDALEQDDPLKALVALRNASEKRAEALASELALQLSQLAVPSVAFSPTGAIAGSESVYHTLSKIASGGSQASQEIRELEQTKREVDDHASAIALALELRNHANQASAALQARDYLRAAQSIRPWLEFEERHASNNNASHRSQQQNNEELDDNNESDSKKVDDTSQARAYLGESATAQLRETHTRLRNQVTQLYQQAVQQGDLATLGQLTPVLALIQLESQAVQLYLQFLRASMDQSLQQELDRVGPSSSSASAHGKHSSSSTQPLSPGVVISTKMARVYNLAVQTLRHHLPLVSHCLWQASGDVQVVRLVHSRVEDRVLPLLDENRALRQWKTVTPAAAAIAAALSERATGQVVGQSSSTTTSTGLGGVMSYGTSGASVVDADMDADDCGFSSRIGSLSDVNLCMDETAVLLQHSESYVRFVAHGCREINKARELRGLPPSSDAAFQQTQLHLALAELGGEYATVEHCLLLASMQRSFLMDPTTADPRQYYRPLVLAFGGASRAATGGDAGSGRSTRVSPSALQTSVMDACWFAARKSTQRAFATGHTGTASAMANFGVDALQNVMLEVATQRAEDAVSQLESLLIGSAGSILAGVMQMRSQHHHHSTGAPSVGATPTKDELLRKQHEASQGISRACAALNDLEVASSHSSQLESFLSETTATGFPQDHATEQLQLCVKSISAVTDSFRAASNAVMDNLESVLKPRIRSILGESMDGSSAASSATFIGSSVMKTGERVLSRMNYNLNDEKYNLLQLSEGYMSRLTAALDDLVDPLRLALAPRLWDKLLLDVMGTVSKRVEASLRKCEITSLGALALDADVRDLVTFTKERLNSSEYASNVTVTRACPSLGRLVQIAKLLNVEDLEDVLDLLSSSKRKNNWDLKLDDTKAFLSLRTEFEAKRVNELLRLPEND